MYGFTELVLIDGIMDRYDYVNILANNLVPFIRKHKKRDLIFMQDNDPKHTAKYTKDFLDAKGIERLDWPAYSPDLNPIENVWGEIKRRIGEKEFASKMECFIEVREHWKSLTEEYAKKLIFSMRKRMTECLRANGSHTSY